MLATRIGGGAVLLLLASVALAQEDTTPTRLEPVERVQTPVIALGLDPAESWVGANLAYEEARYGEAIERYRQLIAEGFDSGQLHYNLGNAFLRSGDLGRAIASYRRAQRRRPRDEDLRANLAFARKSAKDAIQPPEPSRVLSTLFFWHFGMSPAELAVAAAILSLLFWGCLALRVRWRNSETLRWIAMSLAIPLLITCSSVLIRWTLPKHMAVVVPREIGARTGPDPGSVVHFQLHAGTEVLTVDRRDGWLRIVLPSGQQGWIQGEYAEEVLY